jgi:hypothetical protein
MPNSVASILDIEHDGWEVHVQHGLAVFLNPYTCSQTRKKAWGTTPNISTYIKDAANAIYVIV